MILSIVLIFDKISSDIKKAHHNDLMHCMINIAIRYASSYRYATNLLRMFVIQKPTKVRKSSTFIPVLSHEAVPWKKSKVTLFGASNKSYTSKM